LATLLTAVLTGRISKVSTTSGGVGSASSSTSCSAGSSHAVQRSRGSTSGIRSWISVRAPVAGAVTTVHV
jgi:hypothetical protein